MSCHDLPRADKTNKCFQLFLFLSWEVYENTKRLARSSMFRSVPSRVNIGGLRGNKSLLPKTRCFPWGQSLIAYYITSVDK